MPQPAHKPTAKRRTEIRAYAVVGTPHHHIAKLMSIDTKTLLKYYDEELRLGKAQANAAVGGSLYKMAVGCKCPSATIFWMKAQAGWREKSELVHTGNVRVVRYDPTQRPPGYRRRETPSPD